MRKKPFILQIISTFQKIRKPLFRGHLGLSNGISPFWIGYFLIELWPNEM